MKKLLLMLTVFLHCPFPVYADGQYAVSGPTLYAGKSQCIKIKDVKLSIIENKLSLRYILENTCGDQSVNFYALAAKYSCIDFEAETFGKHQKRDFSEFSAFINDKRMNVQHSFVAELDDEDVTAKLLEHDIGYELCGVDKKIVINEENNNKYKELIDGKFFLQDQDLDVLMPAWDIRHKYSWGTMPQNNEKEFDMRIEYDILGGTAFPSYSDSRVKARDLITLEHYDPLLAALPDMSFSVGMFQALNMEKKNRSQELVDFEQDRKDSAATRLRESYAIIPLGIAGVRGATDISLRIRHACSLFERFWKDHFGIAFEKAPFAAKVYIGKQDMRPDGNFALKYGQALNASFHNISLPENIYIILVRKSNNSLQ